MKHECQVSFFGHFFALPVYLCVQITTNIISQPFHFSVLHV